MCLGAIQWARIREIYHGFCVEDAERIGFDDRDFHRQMKLPPDQRSIPVRAICRKEALELIREYAEMPEKKPY